MTKITKYNGFTIRYENNQYNIIDPHGYWRGTQYTLAFAKERIDEIWRG